MAWLGGLLSVIAEGVGGFFGFKKAQGDMLGKAMETLGDAQDADANYARASAKSIEALYENGPGIERLWRPLLMWVILGMIIARWFGYVPPSISQEEVLMVYNWLEIGLIGYIPLRSVDKWMKGFQIGSVLKAFINKKLM